MRKNGCSAAAAGSHNYKDLDHLHGSLLKQQVGQATIGLQECILVAPHYHHNLYLHAPVVEIRGFLVVPGNRMSNQLCIRVYIVNYATCCEIIKG